jgi:hypothetical protein
LSCKVGEWKPLVQAQQPTAPAAVPAVTAVMSDAMQTQLAASRPYRETIMELVKAKAALVTAVPAGPQPRSADAKAGW